MCHAYPLLYNKRFLGRFDLKPVNKYLSRKTIPLNYIEKNYFLKIQKIHINMPPHSI
jgi:hypothetical protein